MRMPTELARAFRRIRMERRLSQEDVADAVYARRQSVGRWENGERVPRQRICVRFAEAFGLDVECVLKLRDRALQQRHQGTMT